MRFHVLVGILPHERVYPQPLEIDVTVWVRPEALAEDGAGLDYRELQAAVVTAVHAAPIHYLEELVQRAAHAVLQLTPVSRVRMAARKPHVALPVPLAYVEVSLEQERDA